MTGDWTAELGMTISESPLSIRGGDVSSPSMDETSMPAIYLPTLASSFVLKS